MLFRARNECRIGCKEFGDLRSGLTVAKIVVVALVVAAQAALGLSAAITPASAEEVLGCPLGLEKGKLWVRSIAKYTEHTEWFNPSSGYMEPLPAGWYSKKTEIPVRLGYHPAGSGSI